MKLAPRELLRKLVFSRPSILWDRARKHSFGRFLFSFFSSSVVGYPITILLRLGIRLQTAGLNFLKWLYDRLPYVVSTRTLGKTEPWSLTIHNSTHRLFVRYLRLLGNVSTQLSKQTKISVVLNVSNEQCGYLKQSLNSIVYQVYPLWEIIAVDHSDGNSIISNLLHDFRERLGNHRLKIVPSETNLNRTDSINKAIELSSGDYLLFLNHTDRLTPNALGEFVRYINRFNTPDALYSDERLIDDDGNHCSDPFYKPDFSRYLFNSLNFVSPALVIKKAVFQTLGGFRARYEGAEQHDLLLRLVDSGYQTPIHVPMSLFEKRGVSPNDPCQFEKLQAGVRSVVASLKRQGREATVSVDPVTTHFKVSYPIPNPAPLVSVLIPSRDNPTCLARCLESLFSKTQYPAFEVLLLDNDTQDEKALEVINRFQMAHPQRFRWLKCSGGFNFNAFNNFGAREAKGDYLVLLNNDTEVISPSWIEELLGLAQWPEVGAVGAQLLYEDCTVQHGGVILFGKVGAGHAHLGWSPEKRTSSSLLNTVREVSAVTAACLMIEKSKFFSVAGLDENWMPNGFGDVDFCLRLRKKGLLNLYNPNAKLFHFESKTRRISYERFERLELLRRHGDVLIRDPYFNPNLKPSGDYELDKDFSGCDPSSVTINSLLKNSFKIMEGAWSALD